MTRMMPSTDRSLPIALLRARERVMGPIRALLSGAGLTEQQWRVLRVVQESGPIDPTQIAELACLLLPSLTRILQKLEEKQLITRERDKEDRRRQVVQIAPEGEKVIAGNIEASLALMNRTRQKMGEDRYEALLDLLNELDEIDLSE
ncbi:homoprotocatechuate degradation operon regulator HpaR [Leisingera sp. M527]|uniref:homoprotocatechuate degradation operon regulator HpaR n=1 Tax=unclassified Leisingera TaxID=2614906 RepID=UPI0010108F2F|nr:MULTISPECIES: homoprotocatechuate degradation operon regulator HpaR [unclassified Leisingera]MBQ4827352.1 homoprotocatechuate degradation operon regulator HpaR [Leisingera sp. HS039]MCF6433601.1 homoprotocatechuate degradation operon regulator HpaR [Leisingera sp. MMG026]QAX31129.1 homoprotocatechuate degradation operon regulator HpaR [Leisingera sp. NJS204]QBR34800.1 homoprotocatechuate degradation operon regulator HpaR [Leisingera sp. NJS201]UWQ32535.1 homoprotocatechuate degradation oper